MILSAIAAMSSNRVIGKNNQLPWHLPEDLKYFRDKTKGRIMIMGRKTFESFGGKPLPGRFHIVITRQNDYKFDHPMVQVISNLEDAIALAKKQVPKYHEEVFVVGGSEIYKLVMPKIDRLYLTIIDKNFDGDAFFPEFESQKFQLTSEDKRQGEINFRFCLFERPKR